MAASDLKTLWQLQKIDLELDEFERNKTQYPQTIQTLRQKLIDEKNKLDQKKIEFVNFEKKRKTLEMDLSEKEEKIKKSEDRMMAVKSNEEYLAIKKEIEMSKQQNLLIEEQILEVMLQMDEEKKRLKIVEQSFNNDSQNIEEEIKRTETNLSQLDGFFEEKKKSRESIAKDLKSDLLSWYQRLRKKIPMAVSETKEGRCMGCHISLPPQLNNLIQKADAYQDCPNCHRILIFYSTVESS